MEFSWIVKKVNEIKIINIYWLKTILLKQISRSDLLQKYILNFSFKLGVCRKYLILSIAADIW